MRSRSITGPLIIIAIGVFFLIHNIRPDLVAISSLANFWPFLLIAAGLIGLLEVAFHASRGVNPPPRPLAGAGTFWVVVLCFLLASVGRQRDFRVGPFRSPGVSLFGSDYDYDVNETESSRGVTRIVLDNLQGNLSLKGEAEQSEVRITGRKSIRALNRADADRGDQDLQIHTERRGDVLTIRTEDVSGRRVTQATSYLDITVPRGVSVESRGRAGDLSLDDIDGAVAVSTGRGDIRLSHIGQDVRIEASRSGLVHADDVKGSFYLQGRGSDIQLETVAGPVTIMGEYSGTLEFRALMKPLRFQSSRTEFQVEAAPGTITMDLGALKMSDVAGPVRFRTGTRDIQATDVTEALELSIDRGDIALTETRGVLPRMNISTRNGDITLTLPEKAGFELHGATSQGEIESAFGSSLEVNTSGRSATIKGENGTGPMLNISTGRGTLSLKKN